MATVADVNEWLEKQGEAHFGSNARLFRTALTRFDSQRLPGEPDTIDWVAEKLDVLAERLAKADHLNGASLKTYISRANSALSAYEDWSKNPVGWSPKTKKQGDSERKKRTKPSKSEGAPSPTPTSTPTQQTTPSSQLTLNQEISEALVAIAKWPLLRPFLMQGLTEAMTQAAKGEGSDT